MSLSLTILGCGSSGGVPRIGNDWGVCDPANPKNRRRRCSILASRKSDAGQTNVLIDTSPDLREQMLSAAVGHLDAVWYTHDHADHTHGIDDLRPFYLMSRQRLSVHADAATVKTLLNRFTYCFESSSDYPAIAGLYELEAGRVISSQGAGGAIEALPVYVNHGSIDALCFRFGNAAYMPDANGLPPAAEQALQGLDTLIIDALRYKRHPSHYSLDETLEVIAKLKPKRAILTNLHIDLDYETLMRDLPDHIEPAYDGMEIKVAD